MKQIFRNLKNDNKKKNNDTEDLRGNPMWEKPRTATSTINPLYKQEEYKMITITTSDSTP